MFVISFDFMIHNLTVLKLSKKVHFLQFCTDLSKKFRYVLSENGIAYYAMTYCFGDIRF